MAFGQIRIEEVCTAAGYTRAVFYSQFASLEELNFALYDQRRNDRIQVRRHPWRGRRGADARKRARADRRRAAARPRCLSCSTPCLYAARDPQLAARLAISRDAHRSIFESHLRANAARLTLPAGIDDFPTAALV